jgi:3',5'-cyclic AMP phosphodiesterase CpdA
MATGRLGARQLESLDAMLAAPELRDLFRVLLIHHPLQTPDRRRHARLTDSRALLAILRRHGVDLVLHGHDHRHSTMWFDGPDGARIPALGVPSASAVERTHSDAAAYNLLHIAREDKAWRVDLRVRGLLKDATAGDIRNVRLV